MYVCATGSIPIAIALMMKGMSPGTALVLLMAGPAANIASMLVIGKVLGRKTFLLYLTTLVIGAITCGLMIDNFLPAAWFDVSNFTMAAHHHGHFYHFKMVCSALKLDTSRTANSIVACLSLITDKGEHYKHRIPRKSALTRSVIPKSIKKNIRLT